MGVELYTFKFCVYSQRALIALNESGIPFEHHILMGNGITLPPWLLKITPQGILPCLKDDSKIIIGCDAIEQYLGSNSKVCCKLVPSKKKQYNALIMECKTKLEPLLDQLLDTATANKTHLLKDRLIHELEIMENNIKGPFVLGSTFTWIDIYYWTLLQRMPLLEHLHGISIPSSCTTIKSWSEKLSKRESFVKAKRDTKSLLNWFDSLRGRGNIRPSTSIIEFVQIVNNALRRGIEDIVLMVKDVDFENESSKLFYNKLNDFDTVLREHSRCKVDLILPKFFDKNHVPSENLEEGFDKQKQNLNIMKTIKDKLYCHTQLYIELSKIQSSDPEHPKIEVIKWKLAKLEKRSPKEALVQQLINSLETFNEALCNDLSREETVLSLEKSEKIFTKRESFWINRQLVLYPHQSILPILVPWVVSNLMDPTQIRTFVLYYRFIMPFRFPKDVVAWLKIGLSDELWADVRRQLEKANKAELHLYNIISEMTDRPPVPPRKKTDSIAQINLPSHLNVKKLTKAKRTVSDNTFISSNPLIILRYITTVLTKKLQQIREICISSLYTVNLSTLQDSLDILFNFLLVKHQQEEHVIYPFLKRKAKELRPTISSYLQDMVESDIQITTVATKLTRMRITNPTQEDKSQLIEQIMRMVSLELHNLYKQTQLYDFVYNISSFAEQALLIREILDYSPISFVDTLIPWFLKETNSEKQAVFIMSMKNVLMSDCFDKLLLPIRRVLPSALIKTLLSEQNTASRKSL